MPVRLILNQSLEQLTEAVRKIIIKRECRLYLYQGIIAPEGIDTKESDVLGQALRSPRNQIQLVADIGLEINNNLLPTEAINPTTSDQIMPNINSIREYMRYFINNFNPIRKGGKR